MTAAEVRARYIKSERLALTILAVSKQTGHGVAEAIEFAKVATPAEWERIAEEASKIFAAALKAEGKSRVHPPHSQETVLEIVRQLEQELVDPYANLEAVR